MIRARSVEVLVVVAGLLLTLGAWLYSTPNRALSTAVAAAFAAANFSLSRYSLKKVLSLDPGRGQVLFGLLYVVKFFTLVLALVLLTKHAKLDTWGLVLGFTTLPAAMYALLALELLKRTR